MHSRAEFQVAFFHETIPSRQREKERKRERERERDRSSCETIADCDTANDCPFAACETRSPSIAGKRQHEKLKLGIEERSPWQRTCTDRKREARDRTWQRSSRGMPRCSVIAMSKPRSGKGRCQKFIKRAVPPG